MTRQEKAILSCGILMVVTLFWAMGTRAQAQGSKSALISGTVTANRDYAISEASGNHIPSLYAVRVRARDAERHITYTVFTQKGHYQIYNLPPGTYEMSALQDGFDSKGPTVFLKTGTNCWILPPKRYSGSWPASSFRSGRSASRWRPRST